MPNLTRRTFVRRAAAASAAALLSNPASAQDARRKVVVALPTQPAQIDPMIWNDTPSLRITSNVFESLLRFDYLNNSELKPALAEAWTRIDPLTVEFKLRPNVKFHDGSDVTAEDVVFSFSETRTKGPDGKAQTVASQYQRTIKSVEALDPRTIRITTSVADAALEQKIAAWGCQIVSKKAFDRAGSWAKWFETPIGTGPYRVVWNRKDVGVLLAAHDGYWGGRPPHESVEFRVVPEAASRQNGLLAGDYDLVSDVLPDQFDAMSGTGAFEVVGGSIPNLRVLVIDTTAPWLSDVRIRRAMSLALDRQLIIDSLWRGRIDVPRNAQYPAFGALYDDGQKAPAYDPEQARKLVAEAGYRGEPITYRLMNNWYPNEVLTAQIMLAMWQAVGLNVRIESVENISQAQKQPIQAFWDSSILLFWPDPTALYWRVAGENGSWTRLGIWKSEEFFAAGAKFERSTDAEERKALHHAMLEIIHDQVPIIQLHNNGAFYGKRRDFSWRPYPSLIMDFGPFNMAGA
ncbi:ABC transporter substrate-binding protein [Chelatococcus asaccharovorans]|uniref:Peptide/nickel transport system substrate-binding protein n=1 Tax=Chelatococcus asaccharovorans TaxID=28210 RepID=A0A2V3U440_9HYPH|nr:ABC transporter substrate-binding protein [Chelatococcus asaccharovorans]MBS7703050.1 oligopeptide ABC transporter substrate-binding protein [Chelatococcus asaccharovorans]PXW57349.1 peptide/nickel transport system substrate-binding protein [Chelatococcus asaccharovorans]